VRLDAGGVTAFLRPFSGADIPLYPNASGLGGLATQAVQQALPLVLDAIADLAGHPGVQGDIAVAVAAAGDMLGIRQSGKFAGSRLTAWAADPLGSLEAALLSPAPASLTSLASALDGLLGAAGSAAPLNGGISLTAGQVSIGWLPNPLAVTVSVDTDVPGIDHANGTLTLDATGLRTLDVQVGPAVIAAGGATLRPYTRFRVGNAPPGGRAVDLGLRGAADIAVAGRWSTCWSTWSPVSRWAPTPCRPCSPRTSARARSGRCSAARCCRAAAGTRHWSPACSTRPRLSIVCSRSVPTSPRPSRTSRSTST